jgi:uncharacterized protein (DUF697 family)
MKNKRGMFDNLSGLALGIVIFAIMIGVGVVVLTKFGDTMATCAADYTYDAATQKCLNATDEDPTDPTNTEWVTTNYLNTQLGSTGLAGWAPAIIALAVGLLFIGALTMRSRKY